MTEIIKVTGLCKSFGGVHAANNIDFSLQEGEVRGIIGPNGSGKSTFFNLLTGIYTPDEGTIIYDGHNIAGWEPHRIASHGIARTFQLLRMFTEMSVLDNLMIGCHCQVNYGALSAPFAPLTIAREEKVLREEMMDILQTIGLADYAHVTASEMSIGQRRLLALGRAIAMKPRILMLDEPAAGLSPVNVDNLMAIVMKLKDKYGLTLIIVEHILKVVMETCDRISVLDHGEKIAEGRPDEVRDDHAVIEAYLGKEMADDEVRQLLAS